MAAGWRTSVVERPDPQIWIRDRDQLHARPIPGTERRAPWSPDGDIGLLAARHAQVSSGWMASLPTTVADSLLPDGGTAWGRDGVIYTGGGFRNAGAGLVAFRRSGAPRPCAPHSTPRETSSRTSTRRPAPRQPGPGLHHLVWTDPPQRYRDRRTRLQDRPVPDPAAGTAGAIPHHRAPPHRPIRRVAGGGAVRPGQAGDDRRCRTGAHRAWPRSSGTWWTSTSRMPAPWSTWPVNPRTSGRRFARSGSPGMALPRRSIPAGLFIGRTTAG